ncbi:MAG: alpha/beta hydrolase family protein [Pirellulaceae bacterium]
MKHDRTWQYLVLLLASCWAFSVGHSAEPAPLPATTPWDVPQLQHAPPDFTWLTQEGPVRSLTYRGEPYQGHATSVFAYYASPRTLGSDASPVPYPGIVLVHGGGGKAFAEWAELWAKRGYAAVAMDLAGCGPDGKRLPDGGPGQGDDTKFGGIDGPVTDQWTFHAVANVLRAHSWLLGLPDVDPQRTAVTGISWGGYVTCIVAGVDQRFKVAMPVYGCGFLHENSAWKTGQLDPMTAEHRTKWISLWDPSQYIGSAAMPVVFLNGTNDFAYPLDSYAKTCQLVQGVKHYSIQLNMPHGHIFDFPEFFLFVDQYLKGGTPLPVISIPQTAEGRVTATVDGPLPLVSARLHYTTGPHPENPTRPWVTQSLEINGQQISGEAPPADATVWYVDVSDQSKGIVSSRLMIPGADGE